jgi:hypothetical protein
MNLSGIKGLYHKLVFEVRYDHGLIYLDRCGTTANRIMDTFPEWVLSNEGTVNPQNAPLVSVSSGSEFNFGPLKYDFSLEQPINAEVGLTKDDIDVFVSQVDSVGRIVHEELDLKAFLREGFRVWYVFGANSEEHANQLLLGIKAFQTDPILTEAFSGELESQGHVAVIAAKDRKFRIAVNVVERLEKLNLGTQAVQVLPRKLPRKQREALLGQLKAKRRILANPQHAVMKDVGLRTFKWVILWSDPV